jgi:hypothetical protein
VTDQGNQVPPPGWNDPLVRPAGWATEGPGAVVRRRRRPVALAFGIVLILAGVVLGVLGILALVEESGPDDEDVVAEGTVAALDGPDGEVARFTSGGADDFTVWVHTTAISSTDRESVVAATACEAEFGADQDANFRGSRQGTSVTVGDESTVGWFTAAEGTVEVRCRQEPFGRVGRHRVLRGEPDFKVVRGKPSVPLRGFLLLSAGIILLVVGIYPLTRGIQGRLVRADGPSPPS